MNLLELKKAVNEAIVHAIDCNMPLEQIPVSLQIDGPGENQSTFSSSNIELYYDNNLNTSGCVITAVIIP